MPNTSLPKSSSALPITSMHSSVGESAEVDQILALGNTSYVAACKEAALGQGLHSAPLTRSTSFWRQSNVSQSLPTPFGVYVIHVQPMYTQVVMLSCSLIGMHHLEQRCPGAEIWILVDDSPNALTRLAGDCTLQIEQPCC